VNAGQKIPGSFVVSCCNRPELFEFGEETFDEMAFLIEVLVEFAGQAPVGFRRDDHALASFLERFDDTLVRVIGLVSDKLVRFEGREKVVGARQIMRLSARQMKSGWVAQRIDGGMDLRAQPAAGSSDRLILAGFFWAPALCRWARTMVLSIIAYSLSVSLANRAKMRAQTPDFAQRENRVWILIGSPNRSGRSRHGMPAR
jgi:hypothetical protein